jgi:oxygen-independent coproporphyrinogen III oxidase
MITKQKYTEYLSGTPVNYTGSNLAQPLSLYLHIPFCKTRCTYCDFNTYTNLSFLHGRYVKALVKETKRTLAAISNNVYDPLKPLPVDTAASGEKPVIHSVFFGGGTPSLLPPLMIEKVMDAIRQNAILPTENEVTLEANPGTISLEKAQALRRAGINRLSFGVQTFDDEALRLLGRTHDSAGAIEAYKIARQAGFSEINLDFIYALPDQTLQNWRENLEKAIALEPDHFSLYALTIEENTEMGKRHSTNRLNLPDEDTAADMYLLALEMLEQAGYEQYEISNWAKKPATKHASQHNLVYWRNQPYIGLGVGAHSCYAGYRYPVIRDPAEYIEKLKNNLSVVDQTEVEAITPALRLADTVILALRLNEGLEIAKIEREFGKPLEEFFPQVVPPLISNGLMVEKNGRLRLTVKGRLLSNDVFIKFLPD